MISIEAAELGATFMEDGNGSIINQILFCSGDHQVRAPLSLSLVNIHPATGPTSLPGAAMRFQSSAATGQPPHADSAMGIVRLLEGFLDIARTGIILNTEKYEECVSFYKDLFGLKVLFEKEGLTCFDYYGSYLMVETEGAANPNGKSITENSTKLRFNVADIDQALCQIQDFGIEAHIIKHDWGSTINIYDPDGNRIGIVDESVFENQLRA